MSLVYFIRYCLLAGLVASMPALARDMEQPTNVSPEVKKWVESLKNQNGVSCCATADGWKPEAVQWDADAKGYKVLIEGKWTAVGPEAVIYGPNKLGYAVVWYYHVDGLPAIRCFLPGEGM